ncbi:MAG TPA: DNA (cytosine-5-)-methyltransferase [Terriglobales bacterium]|nr:DNA (cytosine-5-)-methyltransferase [Terriglobales bacterium]
MTEAASATLPYKSEPSFLPMGGADEHTFLEFFAGIGLTHLGLQPHGWKCIYANDIDEKKRRMYQACFGDAHYHVEDVWNTKKIVEKIPLERADLASASFPCVDLSLAGNLKGFDGEQSGSFNGFVKVLRDLKSQDRLPNAVLVENVRGFLSSHDGKFFRFALTALSRLGYCLDAFVVDAKHFVPQSRPRLFIVGFLKNLLTPLRSRGMNEWSLREGSPLRPAQLVRALEEAPLQTGWVPLSLPPLPPENRSLHSQIDLDDDQDWWGDVLVDKHLAEMDPSHLERIAKLRKRADLTVGTIYRRVRNGRSRSEIRVDGLAGCLRTPRGGSSKQIVFVAGRRKIRMRWMSPREYARLQGCPNFPIHVDRNEALFGFGDGVCVPVIEWIAENVLSQLFPVPALFDQPQQTARD